MSDSHDATMFFNGNSLNAGQIQIIIGPMFSGKTIIVIMSDSHDATMFFNGNSLNAGQIQIIIGPMFSGKTTELIRRCKRYSIANYNCIVVKYAKDLRYVTDGVATHDQQVLDAVPTCTLMDVFEKVINYQVVGIDEAQFFPDLLVFTEKLANLGKIVIAAALDGTFQREGFGDILKLIPRAEKVSKLTAVCMMCYSDASFTKRKSSETKVEVIGGKECYMAVCRKCYFENSPSPLKNKRDCNLTELNGQSVNLNY